jgi:sigma-B regulation protein RsbU (phosphoserine phosphatase)
VKPRRPAGVELPDAALRSIHDIQDTLDVSFRIWVDREGTLELQFPLQDGVPEPHGPGPDEATRTVVVATRDPLVLEMTGPPGRPGTDADEGALDLAARVLRRALENDEEIRFFTVELSERYEEINLLYSISETLGSVLSLDEAAGAILTEVCDVVGARRGSLWVFDGDRDNLHLVASVGDVGMEGPLQADDPLAVTAQVFREGRATIVVPSEGSATGSGPPESGRKDDTVLSVPIRYSPPAGQARTVGVINLFGRRRGGRFTASDQKLLSAIASQVGAALENNRLIRESLARERMAREMELAHNLQMKLLPAVESMGDLDMAARVEPAEQVGGDFYHILRLPDGKVGVMIGDVSSHGFPAALIMTLSMSAATIFASEVGAPDKVLRRVDDALREELETTEMYLTLFYGVLDAASGDLTYSNAGHPHAFLVRAAGGDPERLMATDPPVGFAGEAAYGQRRIHVGPKDLLFLFTDGLSDTLGSSGGLTGEQRVLSEVGDMLERTPGEIVDRLFHLTDDATPAFPADDRTAVVLRAGDEGGKS